MRVGSRWFIPAAICFFVLTACDAKDDRLAKAAADTQRAELKRVSEQLDTLKKRVFELEIANPLDPRFALMGSPTSVGFFTGRSSFGAFAAVITDIKAYGAGSKIEVQMLNLAGATLGGVTIKANYGDGSISDMIENPETKYVSAETVELQSTKNFPSNTWVTESITLPELPPERIKHVALGFDASQLRAQTEKSAD